MTAKEWRLSSEEKHKLLSLFRGDYNQNVTVRIVFKPFSLYFLQALDKDSRLPWFQRLKGGTPYAHLGKTVGPFGSLFSLSFLLALSLFLFFSLDVFLHMSLCFRFSVRVCVRLPVCSCVRRVCVSEYCLKVCLYIFWGGFGKVCVCACLSVSLFLPLCLALYLAAYLSVCLSCLVCLSLPVSLSLFTSPLSRRVFLSVSFSLFFLRLSSVAYVHTMSPLWHHIHFLLHFASPSTQCFSYKRCRISKKSAPIWTTCCLRKCRWLVLSGLSR